MATKLNEIKKMRIVLEGVHCWHHSGMISKIRLSWVRPVSPTRLAEDSIGGSSQDSAVSPSDTYSPLPSLQCIFGSDLVTSTIGIPFRPR
jgi:hypothetical protein